MTVVEEISILIAKMILVSFFLEENLLDLFFVFTEVSCV